MESAVFSFRVTRVSVLAMLLIAGCADNKEDASAERLKAMAGGELKKVVPVSGKVLLDGQPKEGVTISLYPEPAGAAVGEVVTNADGTYCWQTYSECDGILPGTYWVAFRLTPKQRRNDNVAPTEDLLKGKYSNPARSKFKLTVADGAPQTNVDYDLATK